MSELNWLVHDPIRLKAMIALAQSPRSFSELRRELEMSQDSAGHLDCKTTQLEEVGYVQRSKEGRCPRNGQPYSMLKLTDDGYQALGAYCLAVESIVYSIRTVMSRTAFVR